MSSANPPTHAQQNPDMFALTLVKSILENLTFVYPDGESEQLTQVDLGFLASPSGFPYCSIHTAGSRAPIKILGHGAGMRAREYQVDLLVAIEYDHPDAQTGFVRLTQIRWDTLRALADFAQKSREVSLADFDEAMIQSVSGEDTGGYTDWGYSGTALIPMTVTFPGHVLDRASP